MIALKKERTKIRKKLKIVEKQIDAIDKLSKNKKENIVIAEKNKQKVLGKRSVRKGSKRGKYRKTTLKKIWLPSVASTEEKKHELNSRGEVVVRFN